jgi:glycosyltransferase involved in cell wall biosynthesis
VTAVEPLVSIVVPTFRKPEPLRQTLASLRDLDFQADQYEIIVVDDGSDPETAAVVEAAVVDMPLVRYAPQSHGGVASARNHGARLARGEVLIFVDDDMLLPQDLIASHLQALEQHAPAVISGYREFAPGLAAALSRAPFGRFRLVAEPRQEWGHDLKQPSASGVGFRPHPAGLPANDLAVRSEDFFRIGGFDEAFPHAGYEDHDFTLRAGLAGFKCLVNYGLVAWHNDRRMTLREFGERQRRGAVTAVLLASKYPERYREQALYRENAPLNSRDSVRLIGKKLLKHVLSTGAGMSVLFALVATLERFTPEARILQRLYTVITGLYIFRGVREGMKHYPI